MNPQSFLRGLFGLGCALALLQPGFASAGTCGDDIDGERVACACGDTVVATTRLQPSDPVTSEPCSHHGLIVKADGKSDSITLDLAGLTIAGSGHGVGILVVHGGRGGAQILGGDPSEIGVVNNFGVGLRAGGRNSVAAVRNLHANGNRAHGIWLRTSETELEGVEANDNGRDGIRISGYQGQAKDVEAKGNGRDGVRQMGGGKPLPAAASDNARDNRRGGGAE